MDKILNKKEWKYYSRAMIPNTAPHELPDVTIVEDGSVWNYKEKPLLARWTTEFDCKKESNWWYCIKDEPFDISKLNSNYRYKINKGKKKFEVKQIDPVKYVDELYKVTVTAYNTWPEKYRPKIDHDDFKNNITQWMDNVVLGAFFRENSQLVGYAFLTEYEDYADFNMLRVDTKYEKLQINAALVNGILEYYSEKLMGEFYVLDGARSISHETTFQEYLEKYFGFRKAYCRLHIAYNPKIKWIISITYPFRKLTEKLDNLGAIHYLNSLLKMEEIVRDGHR